MKDSQLVKWKKRDEAMLSRNIQAFMDILWIDENGKVKTTEGFKLEAYLNILSHHIEIYKVQSLDLKQNLLFRTGFLRLKKYKKQDMHNFRRALAAEVRKHHQKISQIYFVLFPLYGILDDTHQQTLTIFGQELVVDTWENVRVRFKTAKFFQASKNRVPNVDVESNFTPILIQSKGHYLDEVFDQADEYFDLFRFALNLLTSFGIHHRQWGFSKPLAKILPSPVFGIFQSGGEYETCYYNSVNHSEYKPNPITWKHLEDATGFLNKLENATQNSEKNIHTLLLEAIKKYGRALDTDEWRLSFLELWQILELLTLQSNQQLNMKQVLSRVTSLLHHNQFVKDLLMMLYETRNTLVHEGQFSDRLGLKIVSSLKFIVEQTINAIFKLLEDIPDKTSLQRYYEYFSLGDFELAERKRIISIIQTQRTSDK